MGKVERKNFLIISSVLFLVAFVLHCIWTALYYNIVGEKLAELGFENTLSIIVFAAVVSYAIVSVYYLIKLSTLFLQKRKLWFRILLTVFSPITIPVAIFISFIITLPYGLYNIAKIYFLKERKKNA